MLKLKVHSSLSVRVLAQLDPSPSLLFLAQWVAFCRWGVRYAPVNCCKKVLATPRVPPPENTLLKVGSQSAGKSGVLEKWCFLLSFLPLSLTPSIHAFASIVGRDFLLRGQGVSYAHPACPLVDPRPWWRRVGPVPPPRKTVCRLRRDQARD
jgi:hypothetical protein